MTLVDQYGQPLRSTSPPLPPGPQEARRPVQIPGANPGLGDLWNPGNPHDTADKAAWIAAGRSGPRAFASRYGVNWAKARNLTRTLYYLPNPIFQAAVRLVAAFLVGDTLSYAEHSDKTVRQTVEEFWQVNAFGEYMTQRAVIEFLLDGELAMVWNPDTPLDLTARVGALDTTANLEVTGNASRGLVASDMAERLTYKRGTDQEQRWEDGEFVWTAYDALFGEVRGWPPTLAAAAASVAFVSLVNSRLRANELLGRLLALYKAFLNPEGTDAAGVRDGGMYEYLNKARAFREVPEDGAVVPLIIKPGYTVTSSDASGQQRQVRYDSVEENLEFPSASGGAGDAASDLRVVMRLVGTTLGLPEHYLGEGGNATRTTADAMTLPAVMTINRMRAYLRGHMDRAIRAELIRRYGADRLYTVYTWETDPSGLKRTRKRKRVPAPLLEIAWVFPTLTQHTLDELIKLAVAAEKYGWASSQTLSSGFGFDPAVEAELMAANGRRFGAGAAPATTTPAGGTPHGTTTTPTTSQPAPGDDAAGTGAAPGPDGTGAAP